MSEKQAYQIHKWQLLIKERINSGLTIRGWCRANNVSKNAYYYWLKKIREETYDAAVIDLTSSAPVSNSFVEIQPKVIRPAENCISDFVSDRPVTTDQRACAIINKGLVRIEILSEASPAFLRSLLEAVHYV